MRPRQRILWKKVETVEQSGIDTHKRDKGRDRETQSDRDRETEVRLMPLILMSRRGRGMHHVNLCKSHADTPLDTPQVLLKCHVFPSPPRKKHGFVQEAGPM